MKKVDTEGACLIEFPIKWSVQGQELRRVEVGNNLRSSSALEVNCIKKYVLGVHRVGTMKITNEFQPHTAYKHQGFRSGLI